MAQEGLQEAKCSSYRIVTSKVNPGAATTCQAVAHVLYSGGLRLSGSRTSKGKLTAKLCVH